MTNPQSPPTVDEPLSNVFIFAQQNRIHVYLCTPPWQHLQKNKQRPSRSKSPLAEKHTATYTYAVTHRLFSSTLLPETTTYPQKEDAKVPECPHPAPLKTVLNFRGPTTGPCIVPHVMPTTAPQQVIVWSWKRKKRSRPQSQHEQKVAASISTSHDSIPFNTFLVKLSLFSCGIFPPTVPPLPLRPPRWISRQRTHTRKKGIAIYTKIHPIHALPFLHILFKDVAAQPAD